MARMGMGTLLIACPSCSCHAFARETHCPGCGAALRANDGSIQRTAGAVMLGLTLAVSTVACGSDTGGGSGGAGGDAAGGQGGMPATTTNVGGLQAVSAYGVGPGGGFSTSTAGGAGGEGGAAGSGGAGGTGG
jgi:hypothetical protein